MNEEHLKYAARVRGLMTDLGNVANQLAQARDTYQARGYQEAMSDETLAGAGIDANTLLNCIFIVANLDEFMNPTRRNVVSQVRTDF